MKKFQFILLACVAVMAGRVLPALSRQTAPAPAPYPPEQRRTDLRSALKVSSGLQVQEEIEPLKPYDRHMSAQERANLRQQLRQLRSEELSEPAGKSD